MDIIQNSHNYYDKCNEKYKKLLNKIKYFQIIKVKESVTKMFKLHFYDENKNEIFNSAVESFSRLYKNQFSWGWANYNAKPNLIKLMKTLLNYGLDIELTDGLKEDFRVVKQLLLKSELIAEDSFMIDTYCAVGMYLIKKELLIKSNNYARIKDFNVLVEINKQDENPDNEVIDFIIILDPPNLSELNLD